MTVRGDALAIRALWEHCKVLVRCTPRQQLVSYLLALRRSISILRKAFHMLILREDALRRWHCMI